jgi:hypothetical protein
MDMLPRFSMKAKQEFEKFEGSWKKIEESNKKTGGESL